MARALIARATPRTIARAVECLVAGELVAFPTETVYGLGADASSRDAVARIFAAKGRPADHPVIVHIASSDRVVQWAHEFPAGAKALAKAFWPGPLTLILPRAAHVDDIVTGGQDSIGLRVPAHPVARELLASFARAGGRGLAAPSANRFGRISPTTASHVYEDLGDAVSMILDGGASTHGIESTIVSFVGRDPIVLRPGAIAPAQLASALGGPIALRDAETAAPRVSGSLASHYAPRTRMTITAPSALRVEIAQRDERDERVAVLARTIARPDDFDGDWIAAPQSADAYAHALYANLRALDRTGADEILVEAPPADDERWLAVRDRLARAAHDDDDDRD
jgi:L-threonylcarbamoyladenylate synthase